MSNKLIAIGNPSPPAQLVTYLANYASVSLSALRSWLDICFYAELVKETYMSLHQSMGRYIAQHAHLVRVVV